MDPCKNAVPHITFHILGAKCDHLCVIREHSHGSPGCKLHQKGGECAEAHGDQHGVFESLARPVMLAGADILGGKGGYCGQHGGRDEEKNADDLLHDSYGCCIA